MLQGIRMLELASVRQNHGMRMVMAALLVLAPLLQRPPSSEPFAEVGVWYAGPGVRPPATGTDDVQVLRTDLERIRRSGFNTIVTWVRWSDAEPAKGTYALGGTERLIAAAGAADLRVVVVVLPEAPGWATGHSVSSFVDYASRRLTLNPAVLRVVADSPAVRASQIEVGASAPAARVAFWAALARGEKALSFISASGELRAVLPLGETAGVVTRNPALFAPLKPREKGVVAVSSGGGGASIDVKLLESPEAILIVGLNYSPAPRTATITFAPDIPEAIWQNLETGTSVNFVMTEKGPVLEHVFAPRDALVLMIRKTLR
jgi:hypothetical protein